jgi:hypothetical protein
MALDGALDQLEAPSVTRADQDADADGVANEIPRSLVDYLEFYLLNYFKPATYRQRRRARRAGCCSIDRLRRLSRRRPTDSCDRRVADVETVYNPERGLFNNLYATAAPLIDAVDDRSGYPPMKQPKLQPFLVKNIFTDLKRHDVGPAFTSATTTAQCAANS